MTTNSTGWDFQGVEEVPSIVDYVDGLAEAVKANPSRWFRVNSPVVEDVFEGWLESDGLIVHAGVSMEHLIDFDGRIWVKFWE